MAILEVHSKQEWIVIALVCFKWGLYWRVETSSTAIELTEEAWRVERSSLIVLILGTVL